MPVRGSGVAWRLSRKVGWKAFGTADGRRLIPSLVLRIGFASFAWQGSAEFAALPAPLDCVGRTLLPVPGSLARIGREWSAGRAGSLKAQPVSEGK
jgi:hypothetical protein